MVSESQTAMMSPDIAPTRTQRNIKDTTDPYEAQFIKSAFMTSPIIHLNPEIDSTRKWNRDFCPFIRAGLATPCF